MKKSLALGITFLGCSLLASGTARGQVLYSENFDDGNASTRWTAQAGKGYDSALVSVPMDTNFDNSPFPVDGVNDTLAGFAYDYSAAGIPSAPGAGGSTMGMKLQASLFSNALGGFSVNPNGLDLNALSPTGNYSVKFQAWSSTVGTAAGFPTGGSGSTMLSTFGILTTGTASETILSTDGVFFTYTGDGGSTSDYRAYSVEDKNSYDGTTGEPHATYAAASRNSTAALYSTVFGAATSVPQSVIDKFPNQTMTGTLNPGSAGFQWVSNEIRKVGNLVEWYANGTLLITVDMTEFATPTLGGNLSFGHADINFASSLDPEAVDLLFTLIDNIEVTAISSAVDDADFNGDGNVDGSDFLTWQRGFGTPDAQLANGDANGDHIVDGNDLVIWQGQYGGGSLSAISAVPEPTTLISLLGATLLIGFRRRG
jgi:hypothetical protein